MSSGDNISKRQRRLFQRMATGLQIAHNQDADMYFMTLTTSNNRVLNKKGEIRSLTDSFRLLKQRIKVATIKRCRFDGFRFNRYYCLKTEEGNGVLHVIFWGHYIPIEWLRCTWEQIHGAFEVGIEQITKKRKGVNGLVGYLLDRYLLNQKRIVRMSYGWKWAWLGFCKSWKHTKQTYGQLRAGYGKFENNIRFKGRYHFRAVEAWRCTLWQPLATTRKVRLDRFLT